MSWEQNSPKKVKKAMMDPFTFLAEVVQKGDLSTRLSFMIMGTSNIVRGQIFKGVFFLILELVFLIYMVTTGFHAIALLKNLGTVKEGWIYNENLGIDVRQAGDNSMLILLFGILAILFLIAFILIWYKNIKSAYQVQLAKISGDHIPSFKEEMQLYLDGKLHITFLSLPISGILAFTVLPLIFMILIAFTNFDSKHQPPGNLFTWVGLDNFKTMLSFGGMLSDTFWPILGWTLFWAVAATVTTFIGGVLLALLLNKSNVKIKPFWRMTFILSIAVPQFVSLLIMRTIFEDQGAVNILLKEVGLISSSIPFWDNVTLARIMIIVINLWIGIPYTMLTVTGILMNVPSELYEAARVDGANKFRMFISITMPYLLFIMTPSLITAFIGNINNFNVIYFLTAGGPSDINYFQAGKTDLLVTWLYKLTVNGKEYAFASTIGILVFIISAVFSLMMYRKTAAYKDEGDFS